MQPYILTILVEFPFEKILDYDIIFDASYQYFVTTDSLCWVFFKFGNKWAWLISCTLHFTIKWFSIPTHWDGYKFFSGKCFFFGTHFSCYWQPFQNANNLWIIYVAFLPWYSRMQITIDSLHTSFAFIKFSRIQDNSGMVTYYHFL